MGKRIYLDYNSTTPVDKLVVEAMLPTFSESFGNPSSENHDTGLSAREMVEMARAQVAGIVNMRPRDVIFTSGATEANNLAIHGMAAGADGPFRAAVSGTEHKSVLEPYGHLKGAEVRYITVSGDGLPEMDWLSGIPRGSLDIISVMAANSETGVIAPMKEITELAHEKEALVHCDATQAVGKIPFDAGEIDMVTFSSHKIYGPKGCGALVATKEARRRMAGVIHGGGQEDGLRSGTLNVPAIVGFGAACDIASDEGLEDAQRQEKLRDGFESALVEAVPDTTINGKGAPRIPNTSSFRMAGAIADAVIVNAPEIEIATGSACSSSTMEPSHVMVAMGLDRDAAGECLRASVGRQTTEEDVNTAVESLSKAARFIRGKEAEIAGAVS